MIYNPQQRPHRGSDGPRPETIAETPHGQALGDPMIFLNIIGIMRRVDPANTEEYDRHARECTDAIVNLHYHPELGCTLESVAPDGAPELDYTAGRGDPGHDIECSWFMMDEANYRGDGELRNRREVFRQAIGRAGTTSSADSLYFIDALGKPIRGPTARHEAVVTTRSIASARPTAIPATRVPRLVHEDHRVVQGLSRAEYGEWYGYLRRDGNETMPRPRDPPSKRPLPPPSRAFPCRERVFTELIER